MHAVTDAIARLDEVVGEVDAQADEHHLVLRQAVIRRGVPASIASAGCAAATALSKVARTSSAVA